MFSFSEGFIEPAETGFVVIRRCSTHLKETENESAQEGAAWAGR